MAAYPEFYWKGNDEELGRGFGFSVMGCRGWHGSLITASQLCDLRDTPSHEVLPFIIGVHRGAESGAAPKRKLPRWCPLC